MKQTTYTYVYLGIAARTALERAEASEDGQLYECMSIIIYCAFTLEAFLNHIGCNIFSEWQSLKKKLSPKEKLTIIAAQRKIKIDFGKRPYQSFSQAFQFRNRLAHGETEVLYKATLATNKANFKKTNWEDYCTLEYARPIYLDTKEILESLEKKLGLEPHSPFLMSTSVGKKT